jgi:glycosyltransferase involved in cell wall biosynthesis
MYIIKQEMYPKISCILPTYERKQYLHRSIMLFLSQTYPNKELIIIDDSSAKFTSPLLHKSSIKYIWNPRTIQKKRYMKTIGYKRNEAVYHSKGVIVAFWDDDDFYGPNRLMNQYKHLCNTKASITVYSRCLTYDTKTNKVTKMPKVQHTKLWKYGFVGPTIMFHKYVSQVPFKYKSLSEDSMFLEDAIRKGFDISTYENDEDFVYVRHESNTWIW